MVSRTWRNNASVFEPTGMLGAQQKQPKINQIVGVPVSDPQAGGISWISPLAKSLIGKRVGETATLQLPGGTTRLEILATDQR